MYASEVPGPIRLTSRRLDRSQALRLYPLAEFLSTVRLADASVRNQLVRLDAAGSLGNIGEWEMSAYERLRPLKSGLFRNPVFRVVRVRSSDARQSLRTR